MNPRGLKTPRSTLPCMRMNRRFMYFFPCGGRFVRGTLANASTLQLPLLKAAFEIHSLDAWLEVDSVAHACITGEVCAVGGVP